MAITTSCTAPGSGITNPSFVSTSILLVPGEVNTRDRNAPNPPIGSNSARAGKFNVPCNVPRPFSSLYS
jgi:hypothetical protein